MNSLRYEDLVDKKTFYKRSQSSVAGFKKGRVYMGENFKELPKDLFKAGLGLSFITFVWFAQLLIWGV